MKDVEIRSFLLQKFYEYRKGNRPWKFDENDTPGLDKDEYNRICNQIEQSGLLEVLSSPLHGRTTARVTHKGVDVVEGNVREPITMTINDSRISVHGSSQVQIGNKNSMKVNVDIHKIREAIDNSNASDVEKQEAKSLFTKLSNNASFASILTYLLTLTNHAQ